MSTKPAENSKKLSEEQNAIVTHSDGALLVSASAGSGKTHVLIEHILRQVEQQQIDIDQFLVITFTRAAAAELRTRIDEKLAARLTEEPDNKHLRRQRQRLYMAHICTIDALCQDLLNQYGHLLDLNPGFRICSEAEEKKIARTVLNRLLDDYYAGIQPCDGFDTLAEYAFDRWRDDRLVKMILQIHNEHLSNLCDPKQWLDTHKQDTADGAGKQKPDNKEEPEDELSRFSKIVRPLLDLTADFEDRLFEEKRRIGAFGFTDISRMVVNLLSQDSSDPESESNQVRNLLRGQFHEILVDEYQDTNDLQNALFEALSNNGKNLFFVGDLKQSIYRFRGADPGIFKKKLTDWAYSETSDGQPGKVLPLNQNFRSRPQILSAVNDVFTQIMSEECGEMTYGNENKLTWEESYIKEKYAGTNDENYKVELAVLDVPTGRDFPAEVAEARFVAERLENMIEEGFQIHDDQKNASRPLQYKDIAILTRTFTRLDCYVTALNERGIPVDVATSIKIFEAPEVQTVISYMKIIDNPHQDIPLLTLLRSSLFCFSNERIAQIRTGSKNGDFFDAMQQDGGVDCMDFMKTLTRYRNISKQMSGYRLMELLYHEASILTIHEDTGQHNQEYRNLEQLLNEARQLDQAGHRTLFDLLRQIDTLVEENPAIKMPQDTVGVKIMTIHGAKGLEFPVVFLCELNRSFNQKDEKEALLIHRDLGIAPGHVKKNSDDTAQKKPNIQDQFVEIIEHEQSAEEMRLLYVAMTRAKEKLIMPMGMKSCDTKLNKLIKEIPNNGHLTSEIIFENKSLGNWLLLTALTRPESDELWKGRKPARVKNSSRRGIEWNITLVDAQKYREAQNLECNNKSRTLDKNKQDTNPQNPGKPCPYSCLTQLPFPLTPTWLNRLNLSNGWPSIGDRSGDNERQSRFRQPNLSGKRLKLQGAERGTAVHSVMQYISLERTNSESEISEEIQRMVDEKFITKAEANSVKPQEIFKFFSSELGQRLLIANSLHNKIGREYEFSIHIPSANNEKIAATIQKLQSSTDSNSTIADLLVEIFKTNDEASADSNIAESVNTSMKLDASHAPKVEKQEPILFHGIIDCWFEEKKGITIIDYKTDRELNKEKYRPQVESYAYVLETLFNKPVNQKWLYSFTLGEAVLL